MSRPPATSRKLRRVLVLLALFLLCLRAVQTARALLGAEAVPFPRSVPPGIWARNLLVARRAKVDGTLDRGEAEGNENDKGPREDDNENKDEQLQENKEAPAKESELTFKNYDEQMVGKLRELCRARGLPSNGAKAELKAALAKDDEERRPVEAKAASAAVPTGVPVRQRRIWLQQEGNPYSVFLDMDAIVDDLRHLATPDVSDRQRANVKLLKSDGTELDLDGKVPLDAGSSSKSPVRVEGAPSSEFQAKAALRVIKEEDLGPLSKARVPAAKVQDGQRLVGIDACVKACMGLIEKYINRSDDSVTNRVPPTCAARCARGGKTTFLQELGGELAGAQYFPIFVSFNGESPVKRRDNELADAWLYRTIAYALLPDGLLCQEVAAKFGTVTCGESTLQAYFASQKNVVLLVDELNHLLLKSPNPADKEAERRASRFMKDVFLDADGAYMVFTSHIQSTGLDLTQYMEGNSVRGLEITGLPFAAELQELQNMSTAFSGLTHMKAAYYSRVPALLWSSQHDEFLLAQKFSQIEQDPQKHLAAFLREVLGGTPMREIEAFRQLTDGSQKDRPIWITCFMSHFLIQCSTTCPSCGVLGRWLQGMQAAEEKDGKAWEKIIAVAFGLRYIWQQMGGEVHGWLHGHEGAAIECLDANPAAKTVEEAIQQLPQPLQPLQYPTLQLVLPSHAQFEAVDLFAVRREADSTDLVMVAQQKEGCASVNQPRPQTAQHAYWMRGSPTQKGKRKDGWILPSQSEIEQFLGPSLAAAAPATWRDPVD